MAKSRDHETLRKLPASVQADLAAYPVLTKTDASGQQLDVSVDAGQQHKVNIRAKEIKPGKAAPQDQEERYSHGKSDTQKIAVREVKTTEINRVFCSWSPKGKLGVVYDDPVKKINIIETHALSRSVKGFRSLYDLIADNQFGLTKLLDIINQGDSGFGRVIVMALLMGESDLHLNNIGLDANGKIVKIDNDWSYGRLRYKESTHADRLARKFHITSDTLESLPKVNSGYYYPYHWFDQIVGSLDSGVSQLIAGVDHHKIKDEIFAAVLEVILMPNDYFLKLGQRQSLDADHVITDHMDLMANRQQLMISAFSSQEFKDFYDDAKSTACLNDFIARLSQFKMAGHLQLDDAGAIKASLTDRYLRIKQLYDASDDMDKFIIQFKQYDDRDPELVNLHGETPLMLACDYGDPVNVRALLLTDAVSKAINQQNNDGDTALIIAARAGHAYVVSELMQVPGIDSHLTNHAGETAFSCALHANDESTLIALMQPGFVFAPVNDNGDSWAHYAVHHDQPALLQHCAGLGADLNSKNLQGLTPLMLAVDQRKLDLVQALVAGGANLNQDSYMPGETALVRAVNARSHEAMMVLLEGGAELHRLDKCINHITYALEYLRKQKRLDLALPLLAPSNNLDIDLTADGRQITLWHLAARAGQTQVILDAVKQGADINLQESRGYTPLMMAAKHDRWETVMALLQSIDSINLEACVKEDNATILIMAVEAGRADVVELLVNMGANVEHLTSDNESALDMAEGDEAMMRALTASHADKKKQPDYHDNKPAADNKIRLGLRTFGGQHPGQSADIKPDIAPPPVIKK